jgi:hypothetical protein
MRRRGPKRLAAETVSQAEADGYTLLASQPAPITTAPLLPSREFLTGPRCTSTMRKMLEAEIVVLRHQLNVLRRKSPKRPTFGNIDRLIFAGLYGLAAEGADRLGDREARNRNPLAVAPENFVRPDSRNDAESAHHST